jgi:16S rRNA (cytosine1402-N4)-methyltransferase
VKFEHIPVMVQEVADFLAQRQARRFVDGTVGGGGHAEVLLEAIPDSELLGIDRDADALAAAAERLQRFGERVSLVQGDYSTMAAVAAERGWSEVDGVLLDLGVSSHQLDTPARGFSHRADGPLDMRMDRRNPVTAAAILNTASQEELARIFYEYGEERNARRVAKAVVERREKRPWLRTAEFAEMVEAVVGRSVRGSLPPATRCFQALRIAVNSELHELSQGLRTAIELLRPGGRVVVISFHSLEDRLVKNTFRDAAMDCICPPDFPVCRCDKHSELRILTRKPLRPGEAEIKANRRAAPARLRAAEKKGAVRG